MSEEINDKELADRIIDEPGRARWSVELDDGREVTADFYHRDWCSVLYMLQHVEAKGDIYMRVWPPESGELDLNGLDGYIEHSSNPHVIVWPEGQRPRGYEKGWEDGDIVAIYAGTDLPSDDDLLNPHIPGDMTPHPDFVPRQYTGPEPAIVMTLEEVLLILDQARGYIEERFGHGEVLRREKLYEKEWRGRRDPRRRKTIQKGYAPGEEGDDE